MRKGLMKLNDAELTWLGGTLELGGRISSIDVQKGCPWQCITCGIDAPKKSKNMPWSDYMTISDSILDVHQKKDIDVLSDDRIDPFDGSDPIFYHSQDGEVEKTIYHVLKDITDRHYRDAALTTTGWKPGNTYMQRAMEDIVNNYYKESPTIVVCYSFKASPLPLVTEYHNFLKENNGSKIHREDLDIQFMKQSRHVKMMIQNLQTIAPIASNKKVGYDIQSLAQDDVEKLGADYRKYSSLLSVRFIKYLENYVIGQLSEDKSESWTQNPYHNARIGGRYFQGLGRVLELGNISQSERLEENNSIIDSNSPHRVKEDDYFAKIDYDGQLGIYYGPSHGLSRILVPKEHFQIMAQRDGRKEKKEEYRMLAELQGKNILI